MSNVWEQMAKQYEEYYQNQYKRADVLEKQLITKMRGFFPDAKTLLEVGCGTAHFTKWLSTLGLDCVGIDTSERMLKEAKKRWIKNNLLMCDSNNLPFNNKTFDITFFMTSLEFMLDPAAALSEAQRVAKKGIILGLMNKNSTATARKRSQPKGNSFYTRARFYSIRDIEKLLRLNIGDKYEIVFWNTTVFPKPFSKLESSRLPFGNFLGIAVKLEE